MSSNNRPPPANAAGGFSFVTHFSISFLLGDRLLESVSLTSIQTARARIGDGIHVSP